MCGEKNTETNSELQMGTQTVCLVFFVFFFISLFSSFFGYSRQYRYLRYLVEKRLGFVCTGCHNIYPQNVHVPEMRNFHRLT